MHGTLQGRHLFLLPVRRRITVYHWNATVGHLCLAFISEILRSCSTNDSYPEGGCCLFTHTKPRSASHSTAQHNAVKRSTVQYSAVFPRPALRSFPLSAHGYHQVSNHSLESVTSPFGQLLKKATPDCQGKVSAQYVHFQVEISGESSFFANGSAKVNSPTPRWSHLGFAFVFEMKGILMATL